MSQIVSLIVLPAVLLLGWRWPGVLIAACLFTYQAGAVSEQGWIGSAYIAAAAALSGIRFAFRPWRLRMATADIALLLLVGFLCLSMTWAPNHDDAQAMTIQLLLSVCGMYLIARVQPGTPRQLMQEILVGMLVIGAVLGVCLLNARVTDTAADTARLLVSNEGTSAVGLAMPFPYAILAGVAITFFAERRWIVAIGLAGLAIVLYASVISATRSVFLAAGIGIALALLLAVRRIGLARYAVFGVAAMAIGVLVLQFLPDDALQHLVRRFVGDSRSGSVGSDASSVARLYLWHDAYQMFTRHPLLGAGYGSFSYFSLGPYPHNLVLEIASTAGAIGVALLLFWLVALLALLWRAYRGDGMVGSIAIGLLAVGLIQMQVSFAFFMGRSLFLISALGPLLVTRAATTRRRRYVPIDRAVAPIGGVPAKAFIS